MNKFFIVLLIFLSTGCAGPTWQASCWTNALYQATTVSVRSHKTPIRIAISHTPTPGVNHAEAQILKDGQWVRINHNRGVIYLDEGEKYKPFKYISLREALEHHLDLLEKWGHPK